MKKVRLNVADLEATEILSREQLKSVFGGSGSSSGSCTTCSPTCSSDQHCASDYDRGGCTCKANLA
jgi:thiazolylpeptide-type bacteriocin precursor